MARGAGMQLRSVVLALFAAVAGCGDLNDSRCDPPEPHECVVAYCCDPVCGNSANGNGCSNVGYECVLSDSQCMCASDGTWHCTQSSVPKDLSVHLAVDMAQPRAD
jgi:hypothetical protein